MFYSDVGVLSKSEIKRKRGGGKAMKEQHETFWFGYCFDSGSEALREHLLERHTWALCSTYCKGGTRVLKASKEQHPFLVKQSVC